MTSYNSSSNGVDEIAVAWGFRLHDDQTTRNVDLCKSNSLIAGQRFVGASAAMEILAKRMRARLAELDMSQAAAANGAGISPQRMGNYLQGKRQPDLPTLARLASTLQTSTDWLLGLSEEEDDLYPAVIARLLELDGMTSDRASVIAETAQAAVRLLQALPDEGDASLRSRMAAQAAWQTRGGAGPH